MNPNGAIVLEGGGLRVEFARRGDRFLHTIAALDDNQVTPLLESVEGTPSDDWPASPPLQEVHIEQRPDGRRLILGVGMAGSSHWSVSAEFDPASGHMVFDVACRLRSSPDRLGSTYRVQESAVAQSHGNQARVRYSAVGCRLDLDAFEESPAAVVVGAKEIALHVSAPSEVRPCTARWRYTFSRDWAR